MAEKTKWEVIAERRRAKKDMQALIAGGAIDRSWMRYTYCRICGQKTCVNNYPDHKPRIKRLKVNGVIMCPWCKGHGGKFLAEMYNFVTEVMNTVDSDADIDLDRVQGDAEAIMVESPQWKRERALQAKAVKEHGNSEA